MRGKPKCNRCLGVSSHEFPVVLSEIEEALEFGILAGATA